MELGGESLDYGKVALVVRRQMEVLTTDPAEQQQQPPHLELTTWKGAAIRWEDDV